MINFDAIIFDMDGLLLDTERAAFEAFCSACSLLKIGKPMAVATSSTCKRAEEKLNNAGILDFFAYIVGGDQVKHSKPAPEIYLKAASALSSNPSKCLALEDSKNGVKSAVAAGMTVVQIPDLVLPDKELLETGHIILRSLADVLKYEF